MAGGRPGRGLQPLEWPKAGGGERAQSRDPPSGAHSALPPEPPYSESARQRLCPGQMSVCPHMTPSAPAPAPGGSDLGREGKVNTRGTSPARTQNASHTAWTWWRPVAGPWQTGCWKRPSPACQAPTLMGLPPPVTCPPPVRGTLLPRGGLLPFCSVSKKRQALPCCPVSALYGVPSHPICPHIPGRGQTWFRARLTWAHGCAPRALQTDIQA